MYRSRLKKSGIPNLKLIFLRWLRFCRTQNKTEEQKYISGATENINNTDEEDTNDGDPMERRPDGIFMENNN